LFEDVECAFKVHHEHDIYQTLDTGHGCIETSKCSILPAQEYLLEEYLVTWKNLSTLIRMEFARKTQGKVTRETRYYISDEKQETAAYFSALIRGHWSIENQLYWHLGVTFKEDACRARAGYASQNLSALREMSLHIVSEQKNKLGLKKRLYKAALDIEYLKNLIKI
jgi:predicted transposase YbfD/YdcC